MKIDWGLILSAGFGTRMGKIGQTIPKPLFPFFSGKIIDIHFLLSTQIVDESKLFYNTHHKAEEIKKYISDRFPKAIPLDEKEILGSGGAVHNFASQNDIEYDGKALVVNADQFLWGDMSNYIKNHDNLRMPTLLGFNSRGSYSNLDLDKENNLIGVNNKDGVKVCYSGNSILNLNLLKKKKGATNFFETVCDYRNEQVYVEMTGMEYCDLGTLDLYKQGIKNIFNRACKPDSAKGEPLSLFFVNKLIDGGLINREKQSYDSEIQNILNFSGKKIEFTNIPEEKLIVFDDIPPRDQTYTQGGVLFQGEIF